MDNNKKQYKNSDIAVMAVFTLGGALHFIHLEDVAIKAAELSPRRFSWKKYPEQINLEAVRLSLKDELGQKNSRILGSIRDGWMISPSGLSWCISNISQQENQKQLELLQVEIERARKTLVFNKIIKDKSNEINKKEVWAFFRVNEYFSTKNRKERFTVLSNAAKLDSKIGSVLAEIEKRGINILEEEIE